MSAAGILIVHDGQQSQLKLPLQATDNHHAEYLAAIAGFKALINQLKTDTKQITVLYYTDSKIVADSVEKQYAKHYQSLVDELLILQAQFGLVVTRWVPEKQNQGAHHLAQQALKQVRPKH